MGFFFISKDSIKLFASREHFISTASIKWSDVSSQTPLLQEFFFSLFLFLARSVVFPFSSLQERKIIWTFVWSCCWYKNPTSFWRELQWVVISRYNWREICAKDWYQFNWNVRDIYIFFLMVCLFAMLLFHLNWNKQQIDKSVKSAEVAIKWTANVFIDGQRSNSWLWILFCKVFFSLPLFRSVSPCVYHVLHCCCWCCCYRCCCEQNCQYLIWLSIVHVKSIAAIMTMIDRF